MAGNWAGTYDYRAPRHIVVADEDELRAALAGDGPVHALGTRHSFTDLPDTAGTLIEMAGFDRPITIDEAARTVRVTAGTRYGVLAAQPAQAGDSENRSVDAVVPEVREPRIDISPEILDDKVGAQVEKKRATPE